MAAANRRRIQFDPAGPFLIRKNFDCSGEKFTLHQIATADQLGVGERRLEQLFNANFFDMAPFDRTAAHPLDRDGDGGKGGSLTAAEKFALEASGYTLKAWLKLPEHDRAEVLAKATGSAAEPPETPAVAPEGPEAATDSENGAEGATGPENGPDETTACAADEPDAAPEAGQEGEGSAGVTEASPTDTTVAAYKHFGFGKYHPINAAGETLDEKPVSKSAAAGLAATAGVPVLGQNDTLGG